MTAPAAKSTECSANFGIVMVKLGNVMTEKRNAMTKKAERRTKTGDARAKVECIRIKMGEGGGKIGKGRREEENQMEPTKLSKPLLTNGYSDGFAILDRDRQIGMWW